jgi:hypothetical protein
MKYNNLEPHPRECLTNKTWQLYFLLSSQSFILYSKLAIWGLTGVQNEAITHTILCCDKLEGFGPEVDDKMPKAMVFNSLSAMDGHDRPLKY